MSSVITTSGLKSILKHETSASRPKKRLRFSTPRDRTPLLWSMIVLWDPDDLFVSRWQKCLVLPMAYECWAGKSKPNSFAVLLVSSFRVPN